MTVKELIEKLKGYPEDMLVMTDGYEEEYELIMEPKVMELVHRPEAKYYTGEYQERGKDGEKTITALVLPRNARAINL